MRAVHSIGLAFLAGFFVLLAGCVELDGQRVSWYYDEATDELQILIHYDGVHDSGSDKYGKGTEQLEKFVRGGEIMFGDWPFHFSIEEMRKSASQPDLKPRQREATETMIALLESARVETIGYYREPDGKLGAAQRITIPHAKAFVRKLNRVISLELLEGFAKDRSKEEQKDQPTPSTPQTVKRIEAAAKAGHQWVTLDGHALRIVVPVHPGEWNRVKGEFIADLVHEIAEAQGKPDKVDKMVVEFFRVCAFTPLGYLDRGDEIEVVIGRVKTPTTLRNNIREAYEPSLEKTLLAAVKTDLDEQLAAALLDKNARPSPAVDAVLKFGPTEDQVRALVAAFEKADAKKRETIVARLNSFAVVWNRDRVVPEAPTNLAATIGDLSAWKKWYAAVKHYPPPVEKRYPPTPPLPPTT